MNLTHSIFFTLPSETPAALWESNCTLKNLKDISDSTQAVGTCSLNYIAEAIVPSCQLYSTVLFAVNVFESLLPHPRLSGWRDSSFLGNEKTPKKLCGIS